MEQQDSYKNLVKGARNKMLKLICKIATYKSLSSGMKTTCYVFVIIIDNRICKPVAEIVQKRILGCCSEYKPPSYKHP